MVRPLSSLLCIFCSENKTHKMMGCLFSWDEPYLSLAISWEFEPGSYINRFSLFFTASSLLLLINNINNINNILHILYLLIINGKIITLIR